MHGLLVMCVFFGAGCAASVRSQPYVGTLPAHTELDMNGAFKLSPKGKLRLALATPCQAERIRAPDLVNCDPAVLKQIRVVARAPWGQDIPGTWNGPAYLEFPIDWKSTGVDPLADNAAAVVAQPWSVSGTQWTPTPAEAQAIVELIGKATETETDLVKGGSPPNLEVTAFEVEGNALHAGEPETLKVRISNRGPGIAYRVAATTRSSVDALHGRRLSFGTIPPGTDKVRTLSLTVPETETERDTMLVLQLTEGNGAAPHNVNRRIPIAPSTAAPALTLRCAVEGKPARPDLDAGQQMMVQCTVDNTGKADAKQVELDLTVAAGPPTHSLPQAIAPAQHVVFNMPLVVPRDLPIDAAVEIAITARDRPSSRTARTTIIGVVRKPRLCVPGQLTREQYRAKLTELRAEVVAGDLTQAQLDRYDAELVACLK